MVQLAAFLDRLTVRQIVAFIPVLILILAYTHSIPLPPELMLVGDVLAYIDIFSVIVLLSIMSRAAAILFILKQVAEHTAGLVNSVFAVIRRLDFRHPREGGAGDGKRSPGRVRKNGDDEDLVRGLAWA